MATSKIAITLDENLIKRLDEMVLKKIFSSRSRAIQIAVKEKLERMDQTRLARECAKLDPNFEQAMAEEGISAEQELWPDY